MDRILEIVNEIPPVTKYWVIGIFLTSVLTTSKLVLKNNLIFVPDKALGVQCWRLVTSFCYFEDLSLRFLLYLWLMMNSSRFIEESFKTSLHLFPFSIDQLNPAQLEILNQVIDKNRSIDYFHYLILICSSIVITASFGYYLFDLKIMFLGPLLDDILFYIWCRKNSLMEINILGIFTITAANLPWCYAFLNLLMSDFFQRVLDAISNGKFTMSVITKEQFFWRVIIYCTLGHFWWYTRDFLLPYVYWQKDKERRLLRAETFQIYRVKRANVVRTVLAVMLLPPWYWIILQKIRST
ncbi:uncharacterized protein PRCAT00003554001 [Priceomyces carsonii]|uniref:uncharacterized protein n=1 Tax=Priceomyces carsonii TaxID=28549 RepID=UPI002ED8B8AB|nr:unnamed protein product [Priceomyces carsonii]